MAQTRPRASKSAGGLAQALRLAEDYVTGRGAHLHRTGTGKGSRVLDLTGGGGALVRGHNPPDLTAAARQVLRRGAPLALSTASSPAAAELTDRLARLVRGETGRPYRVTLTASEAEAMEAALLHVQLERRTRVGEIERDRRRNLVFVRRRLRAQEIRPSSTFLRDVATALKLDTVPTFEDAVFELIRHAREVGRRPGTVFALAHAYHGRTTGALAVSYDATERAAFARQGARTEFLDLDDVERLHERMKRNIDVWFDIELDETGRIGLVARPFVNVAAIVVEPVLVEGAVKPVSTAFMAALREAADRVGCPLVVDESRTGLGWTGRALASAATGVAADYYVLGAALGGGVARLGALLVHESRFVEASARTPIPAGAGDELSCRVALAQLDALGADEGLSADVAASVSERAGGLRALAGRLAAAHPTVFRGHRGEGLLLGLSLQALGDSPSPGLRMLSDQNLLGPVVAGHLLHEDGIRLLPCTGAPSTLRVAWPLAATDADLAHLEAALDRVAGVLERGNFALLVRYLVSLEGRPRTKRAWANPAPTTEEHPYARKVAFLGHSISAQTMPHWEPSLAEIPEDRRDELAERLQSFLGPTLSFRRTVRSATGELVTLHFLGLTLTSRSIVEAMGRRDLTPVLELIEQSVERAVELGCSVIGFGGFTAVLTKNCRDIVEDRIATTSGISFTVVAGLEATLAAARDLGIHEAGATAGVIGAWTDLARNYAAVLSETVGRMVLVGPKDRRSQLEGVAAELYFQALKRLHREADASSGLAGAIAGTATLRRHLARPLPAPGSPATVGPAILAELRDELGGDVHVVVADDMGALRSCDLVVAGAPRGRMDVEPAHLKEGPVVVCDIALPASVSPAVRSERPDVPVLLGGLVRLPLEPDFVVPGIPLPPGTVFGCMAETMLLGLTGIMEDYSVGQLTQIKIHKIKELAAIHGFELGYYKTIASM